MDSSQRQPTLGQPTTYILRVAPATVDPPVVGSAPQHSCAHAHTYAVMQSCACMQGSQCSYVRVGLYHITRRYVPECEVSVVRSQQSVPNQCKTNVTVLAHSCNVSCNAYADMLAAGIPASSPQLHGPLGAVGVLIYGLARPMR